MNQHFEVTAVSADKKELERVAQKFGVKSYHVEMTRKITPIQDLKAILKLYQFLKKEKPEMVHTHTPKAGLVGMIAAQLAGVPVRLHTVAGLPLMEATGMKRIVLNIVEKITYACAHQVYPNSKGLYDFILQNSYTSADKLKVIGEGSSNGIDTSYFSLEQIKNEKQLQLKQQLNIQPNDFVFIFVGRLVSDKGINELVQAFQNLETRNQESEPLISSPKSLVSSKVPKLLLVGPLEAELDPLEEKTIKEITTNPNIISVGFQKDVRPYFAIANALVFPSYREGFPNVVMQAGAMELPSVGSDINGCNEIITHGVNGLIVPPKDAEALAAAMEQLLNDEALYRELKKNARSIIAERYEQHVVWNALLTEYRMLLQESGG